MSDNMTALLDGPAAAPPPGVVPQLDDPPNQIVTTNILPILSMVLGTLLIGMRFYTSAFIVRRICIADYSLLVAFPFFIVWTAIVLVASNISPGIHMWDLRLVKLPTYLYYFRITSCLYAPTIFFIKLSILVQYIFVFMPNKRPRYLYWATILFIGCNFCAYAIILGLRIWSCNPISKSWDPFVTDGWCLDTKAVNISTSAVNLISDTFIFLLPQAIIWRLNMTTKQKFALSLLFFLAILAIVSAAMRSYYVVQLMISTDDTLYLWQAGMWALAEMDCGIMVASLPAAGAFCQHVRQSRVFSAVSDSVKRMFKWRRLSPEQDTESNPEDGRQKSPSLVQEGNQENRKKISWVKTYGVAGLDTLASVDQSQPIQDAGWVQRGYSVSIEHQEHVEKRSSV